MAGWINSAGTGTGRGAGGRAGAFTNHRYANGNGNANTSTSDTIHGGTSGSGGGGGGSWRGSGDRSRGRQPQYRYRPVDRQSEQQQVASGKDPDTRNAANFECNVCFDMAAEPVVTKCGHLFCWKCLYQWLHVHSHHRECPVCKGQVADDAIIPIYGRGGSAASVDLSSAPPRPTGARVESSRQQQHTSTIFMDDDDDNDPFDFRGMLNFDLGATAFRNAVMSFMAENVEDVSEQYEDYSYEYDDPDDYHLLGFPVSASAGAEAANTSSSQAHAGLSNNMATAGVYHPQEFGANASNRGRHCDIGQAQEGHRHGHITQAHMEREC